MQQNGYTDQAHHIDNVIDRLGGRDNGLNVYPGIDGIQHVAAGVRYFRESDPPKLRPIRGGRVHSHVFNLSGDGVKEYERVASRAHSMAAAGKAVILCIDRQYDAAAKSWLVYLEWIEYFTYDLLYKSDYSIERTFRAR